MAALDKHDNVGVLDSYFPNADFFTEFERFDRHLDKGQINKVYHALPADLREFWPKREITEPII